MGKLLLAGGDDAHVQHIPVEWVDDVPQPIAISHFPFDELDSPVDRAREEVRAHGGKSSAQEWFEDGILREWLQEQREWFRREAVEFLLHLVLDDCEEPGLRTVVLGFAGGALLTSRKPMAKWAKEYGVSLRVFRREVAGFARVLAAFDGDDSTVAMSLPGVGPERFARARVSWLAERRVLRKRITNALIAEACRKKKPGLAMVQLGISAGILLATEMTGPQWAERFGISKQAVEEGVEGFRDGFGLRQTRANRDEAAREKMRQSNHRRRKS